MGKIEWEDMESDEQLSEFWRIVEDESIPVSVLERAVQALKHIRNLLEAEQ